MGPKTGWKMLKKKKVQQSAPNHVCVWCIRTHACITCATLSHPFHTYIKTCSYFVDRWCAVVFRLCFIFVQKSNPMQCNVDVDGGCALHIANCTMHIHFHANALTSRQYTVTLATIAQIICKMNTYTYLYKLRDGIKLR